MSLQVTRPTLQFSLELLTNNASPEDLTLRLFTNNISVSGTTVVADLTEADFTGYEAVPLTAEEWSFQQGAVTTAEYSEEVVFVSTADEQNQQVYGYYLTGNDSGLLRWAENFPSLPDPIANTNDTIRVTPYINTQNRPD